MSPHFQSFPYISLRFSSFPLRCLSCPAFALHSPLHFLFLSPSCPLHVCFIFHSCPLHFQSFPYISLHFLFLSPSCPFQFPFVYLSCPLAFLSCRLLVPCMSLHVPLFPPLLSLHFLAFPLRSPVFFRKTTRVCQHVRKHAVKDRVLSRFSAKESRTLEPAKSRQGDSSLGPLFCDQNFMYLTSGGGGGVRGGVLSSLLS